MLNSSFKRNVLATTLVALSCFGIVSTASAATNADFIKTNLKLDLGSTYQFQNPQGTQRNNQRQSRQFEFGSRGGISQRAAQAPGVDHTFNRRGEIFRFSFN